MFKTRKSRSFGTFLVLALTGTNVEMSMADGAHCMRYLADPEIDACGKSHNELFGPPKKVEILNDEDGVISRLADVLHGTTNLQRQVACLKQAMSAGRDLGSCMSR